MVILTSAEFARPTDTNAYAIGDIISNDVAAGAAMSFSVPPSGGNIVRVSILKSTNAVNLTQSLALFRSDPGVVNDNAAFALTYANRATYIGTLAMATPVVVGSIAHAELVLSQPFPVPTGALYGVLIATAAVAAGSAETFSVRLSIV